MGTSAIPGLPSWPVSRAAIWPWLALSAVLLLLALLAAAPLVTAAELDSGELFGRTGKRFANFKPLPQWQRLLERYRAEEARDGRCRTQGRGNCPFREWHALIERLRDQDPMTQLREVNRFANEWRYVRDPINWGVEDYWATPTEFFDKAGDCEDYAIVKFMSLRALGFGNDQLRLVAVEDLNLDVGHAVAIAEVAGRTFLLDNQVKAVVETRAVHHYKPVFAANELAWWLYR